MKPIVTESLVTPGGGPAAAALPAVASANRPTRAATTAVTTNDCLPAPLIGTPDVVQRPTDRRDATNEWVSDGPCGVNTRPPRGGWRDRREQRLTLPSVGGGNRRVTRRARLDRERRDVLEDRGRRRADVLELQALDVDTGLFLEPAHHRVAQLALASEVAV